MAEGKSVRVCRHNHHHRQQPPPQPPPLLPPPVPHPNPLFLRYNNRNKKLVSLGSPFVLLLLLGLQPLLRSLLVDHVRAASRADLGLGVGERSVTLLVLFKNIGREEGMGGDRRGGVRGAGYNTNRSTRTHNTTRGEGYREGA